MTPLAKLSEVIAKYKALTVVLPETVANYSGLRESVLLAELGHELELVESMLQESENFNAALKLRIARRAVDKARCLAPEMMAQSISNQMYWELVELALEPKTLAEALSIFYPDAKQLVRLALDDEKASASPIELNAAGALQTPPTLHRFTQIVVAGGYLLDVASLQGFPIWSLVKILTNLKENYPTLSERLVNYNELTRDLVNDVVYYQGHHITPRAALEALIKRLTLGDQCMTGQEFANDRAYEALARFLDYFEALPGVFQDGIKALGAIFSEELGKGDSVETTGSRIARILQAHQANQFLDSRPQLSEQAFKQLVNKYPPAKISWQDAKPDTSLVPLESFPAQWLEQAVALFFPKTGEDLIALLLNLPLEHYTTLWGELRFDDAGKMMEDLCMAIRDGFFTLDQRKALAEAIVRQQIQNESSLYWAAHRNDCFFIEQVLSLIPEGERLEALKVADEYGDTVLHSVVYDPKFLQAVLKLYPEGERLTAVKVANKNGDTVLHRAEYNSESLRAVLELYPERERLTAVKLTNNDGKTVLGIVAHHPKSLQMVLDLYPVGERLAAVKVADKYGNTVLHTAALDPESLRVVLELYPVGERLAAVKVANKYGSTVLHSSAHKPETLQAVLRVYPEGERLEALKVANYTGETALYIASYNTKSLQVVLELLPEVERLGLLRTKFNGIPISRSIGDNFPIEGSFIREYLIIEKHVRTYSGYDDYSIFAPANYKLSAAIEKATTFTAIKQAVISYLGQENNRNSPAVKNLLAALAPGEANPYTSLCKKWNFEHFVALEGEGNQISIQG